MAKLDEDKKGTKTNKKCSKTSENAQKQKKYRVDIRMPHGKRISKVFYRKYDADQFRAKMLVERQRIIDTGINIDGEITFKKFAEMWLKEHVIGRKAEKTIRGYKSNFKMYILPVLGEVKLKHINYHHAKKLESYVLKQGKKNRTVNKVMMVLKTVINEAVKLDYLVRSPIRGFKELKEDPSQLDYWSKEEIQQFIDKNQDNPLLDFYQMTLNTGLRLGEICGLCWDRVDFNGGFISINRSLTREGLRNTTKTHKGRYIPMNDKVRVILENRLKTRNSQFVFSTPDGEPLPYSHINQRHFKKAQRIAGLSKIIRFHDLRHTFASHFMMNGGNLYTLQKLLGHTDIKTTMIYAHLDKDFMIEAANVVSF
ncbi:putative integrase [Halobacteriovorax sp. BALOs_7]|uniref:tyrosine-type recombinase/integrase n=1 Tax=Halobacteriovorax sp. BALOs_7 TaxID=2109558 RepID=UPI000EA3B19C|nr:site-specific integrase [Halobacteriovorax sp. BALOs_7]AYF43740.1 putative integrase [Halobacteriovorax sp. BALOs_7]